MIDLSQTIAAKSDQLNADDLIGGKTMTITVTRVAGMADKEQPIAIYFEGDGGKPYKPGKSMRRVLVNYWGKNGEDYVGRSMTLYRDPTVEFGKIRVGGIRISHLSDIPEDSTMALAVTRGAKRAFQVKRLVVQQQQQQQQRTRKTPAEQVDAYIAALDALESLDELRDYQLDERRAKWASDLKESSPELHARVVEANSKRAAELSGNDDDGDDDAFPDDEGGQ